MSFKIGKYRVIDLINPVRWYAFVKFKVQEFFGYVTPEDKQWQSEVIVFRGIMCSDCKEAGHCLNCGCNWAGKSGDMSMECSKGNWKSVKNKEDWDDQKSKFLHGLKFGFVKK
jgi:hypothetical protein